VKPSVTSHPHPSERGAAAVEFALSAIVLFGLIFGCITLALAFYTYEVVNGYARDASRYAIVHGNGCVVNSCNIGLGDNFYIPSGGGSETSGTAPADTKLFAYLNNEIFPGINGTKLTVATAYGTSPAEFSCSVPNCNGAGDQVTVTVSYPYLYAIPFIPQQSFTMSASSTMTISQ
jgi:Flp pilus assembly pilin Flp